MRTLGVVEWLWVVALGIVIFGPLVWALAHGARNGPRTREEGLRALEDIDRFRADTRARTRWP